MGTRTEFKSKFGTCPQTFAMPQILIEDAFVLAVDKPSGLLTVRDRWDREQENLHDLLEAKTKQKIYVVHRLDKDTSGVVVFAKTPEAHRELSLQFETRFARKEYFALVRGVVTEESGSMTYPITEDVRNPGVMMTSPLGKSAQTDFSVLERFPRAQYSWLSLRPLTGRTHQVRLHLRSMGYPVVGDTIYGSGDAILLSNLKKRYKLAPEAEERPLLKRLALHAHTLKLKHPKDQSPLEISAPVPKDLEITLRYFRKFGV